MQRPVKRDKGAQLEIAEANRRAEADTLSRVKIEERLAWLRIMPDQYLSLSKTLLPFAASKVTVFVFDNDDIEAKTFAADLFHLFHDGAKWEAVLNDTNEVIPLPTELTCRVDTSLPAGEALADVMAKFPGASIIPSRLAGVVGLIRVGSRPPP